MRRIIRFYHADEEYGFLSNFSRHAVLIDGRLWPTTEHYYQAMKFSDWKIQEEIRCLPSPDATKKYARRHKKHQSKSFHDHKQKIMLRALLAKFTQHSDLYSDLIFTGNHDLVEHAERDSYWGDGGDGSGKNVLGNLLMYVRNILLEGNIY